MSDHEDAPTRPERQPADRRATSRAVSPFDTTRSDVRRPGDGSTQLPQSIGPYRIVELIGSGGMGEVYLAHDPDLGRNVALKRVRDDQPGGDLDPRFEVEARVTAFLQHPSIIPIYHFEKREGEKAYYTMRPVEGRTLGELIEELREGGEEARDEWPMARIVRLFLQATNAVGYAHSRGVIHRDLKPSNIMIGPFEEVLVLDWGVAKIADEAREAQAPPDELAHLDPVTDGRALIGTPAYMAPEQLDERRADERTDVFSLGVILYELLALRPPWKATSMKELLEAMRTPPDDPALARRAPELPSALSAAVLRALSYRRRNRFSTVAAFSQAVASALEGRGRWQRQTASRVPSNWRLAGGRLRAAGNGIALRARGDRKSLRYVCTLPFSNNASVELEVRFRGKAGLAVWLNARLDAERNIHDGYSLSVLSGKRRTLPLRRSGRVVAGARWPELNRGEWHRVRATRDGSHLTLVVNGDEIYSYGDPIPLTGGYVALTAEGPEIELRNLSVSTRGTDALVSCLAVPDAFYNRGLFDEARAEYDAIGRSHPGRNEGRVAQFRSGLCTIEMARRESDTDVAALYLDEAEAGFDQGGLHEDSCLVSLGRALVAAERDDYDGVHRWLASSLTDFAEDPHLLTAREWMLGQLHTTSPLDRKLIAAVLPVALRADLAGWGSGLVDDLVRQTRAVWETPSFVAGRGRYRSGDAGSRAESEIFFAFWGGHVGWIAETVERAAPEVPARPHLVSDAVWCLLELGALDEAQRVLDVAAGCSEDTQLRRHETLARSALLALEGETREAGELVASLPQNPGDRAFNSARIWLGRGALRNGGSALSQVRRLGAKDYFAREHRAWFALLEGEPSLAEKELGPLVEREDHLNGRNLVNLLHGATFLSRGDTERAGRVFGRLQTQSWPRTWTLGSHRAVDRLGTGCLDDYLEGALPYERSVLLRHEKLLRAAGWSGDALS